MRYSTHDYAKALAEVMRENPAAKTDVVVKNFMALVRKNGDEGRLKNIVAEAARFARRGTSDRSELASVIREIRVESARPLSKAQMTMVKNFLKSGDVVEYAVNPDLVAGVKIIVNDEMQFDGTMKAKLEALFGAEV